MKRPGDSKPTTAERRRRALELATIGKAPQEIAAELEVTSRTPSRSWRRSEEARNAASVTAGARAAQWPPGRHGHLRWTIISGGRAGAVPAADPRGRACRHGRACRAPPAG